MTKRHYIIFAEEINKMLKTTNQKELVYTFAVRVADICKQDNHRFNLQRFMEACGFDG